MSLSLLILVLLAPLPYWLLGLPWVLGGRRVPFAPMLGCAIAGLCGEFAMMAGLPVKGSAVSLLAASAVVLAVRRRELASTRAALVEWLPWYGVAVFAASVSPFPVLGPWSGDWLTIYEMGQAVLTGTLAVNMLARPPLFGAAAVPLWLWQDGLVPYQLMAAVASAASIGAACDFMRFVRPQAKRVWLLPLLLSPFFLHNTAAAWSKLLAGAFVLAAVTEAFRGARWVSAIFFALALAIHEGFVIWAPCVLLCHTNARPDFRTLAKASFAMAVASLAFVAPLLVWILLTYGLQAKIAANPTITDLTPVPLYVKTGLGVIASFVAWGSLDVVAHWLSHPNPLDPSIVVKEGYWLATSWITVLAACLLGVLWPFLPLWRAFRAVEWSKAAAWLGLWATVGIPIAIVLNSALGPFYSSQGMLQNALSPLALGAFAFLAAHLFSHENRAFRVVSWATAILGTSSWVLVNTAVTAGLVMSEAVRQRMRVGSEGDYFRVLDNQLEPLGLASFPTLPLLCLLALAGAFGAEWFTRARALAKATYPDHSSRSGEVQDECLGARTRP